MLRKVLSTSLLVLLILLSVPEKVYGAGDASSSEVEKTLRQLDKELLNRQKYMAARQAAIDSVRRVREKMPYGSGRWLEATLSIASRFGTFNNDSALAYLNTGLLEAGEKGNKEMLDQFHLHRAVALARTGMVNDALVDRRQVDSTMLHGEDLAEFYSLGRQMFSYISTHYEGMPEKYDYWRNQGILAQKELLTLIPRELPTYRRNLGEYYLMLREYSKASQTLEPLVKNMSVDDPEYAIACHVLAEVANSRGDHNTYLLRLAQSAMSDLRRGNCEVTSLQELGGALFEKGDTRRAHDYLTVAMANAVDSRASARIARTTELLNVVERDHQAQISSYKRFTLIIIVALALVLVLLAVAVFYLRKQLTKVSALKERLQDAGHTKDVYISQFMTLCSTYMDRLRDFSKLVNRKISAGHADELLALTKSGKFIDEQSRSFYEIFDDAFLHIYPDFVSQVNALLKPEEDIAPDSSGSLTPALRILAFMRLGIDDAGRIARALNLSVNTVYAYRNRMRNRAIDRDNFEASVMAIRGQ